MLRLGTRGSALAMTQSSTVAEALAAASGAAVELVVIRSAGDDVGLPLAAGARPGMFVATLRDRLLAGEVDLVVHSYKDLPSEPQPGLVVGAVPARQDPRDALISACGADLSGLPAGCVVGTSSPRRIAALRRARPDLQAVAVRGNVDTRIGMVRSGRLGAVVLARAGLLRLGLQGQVCEVLDPDRFVPAPAQGALAVEVRTADLRTWDLVARITDAQAEVTVAAERAVLQGVAATCTTAIGATSWITGTGPDRHLHLLAELTDHLGVRYAQIAVQEAIPGEAALQVAAELGARAAAGLLADPSAGGD